MIWCKGSNFILLHVEIPLPQHHLVKSLSSFPTSPFDCPGTLAKNQPIINVRFIPALNSIPLLGVFYKGYFPPSLLPGGPPFPRRAMKRWGISQADCVSRRVRPHRHYILPQHSDLLHCFAGSCLNKGPYLSPASGGYCKYQIRLFTQENLARSGALSKCKAYSSGYYTSPSWIRPKNRSYF